MIGEDNDELVPAIADRVAAFREKRQDNSGQFSNGAAGVEVTVCVDDRFELVDIRKDHSRASRGIRVELRLQRLVQIAGVVEAREAVQKGQLTIARLTRPQLQLGLAQR